MLLDKKQINYIYAKFNQRLTRMKTIPAMLHPVPITSSIHANKVFWKGGFPGLETDWNIPQNWSNDKIPSWKTLVVISPQFVKNEYFPTISSLVNDIAQLEIKGNAQVNILEDGKLTIDGLYCDSFGLINHGTLSNEGELNIKNTKINCIRNFGLVFNENSISLDQTITEGIYESEESSFVNCGEILELVLR